MPRLPEIHDAVLSQYEPGRTVVASHFFDLATRVAQDRHGFPVATILIAPSILRSVHQMPVVRGTLDLSRFPRWLKRLAWTYFDWAVVRPQIEPSLNKLRARQGLPPVRQPLAGWLYSPSLTIGLFPSWYGPPQPDWPSQLRLTSFPLFDATESVPSELEAFLDAGPPPVLVTLGSAMAHGLKHFEEAVAAVQKLGRRAVILTQFSTVPANLPPTVRAFSFAPFSKVLPRCAALVHHGGIGTAAAGLAAGIPHLVMPMSFDQPDNAARLRRLGVGDALLPGRFKSAAVAGSLDRLLSDPAVKARCADLAERTTSVDGLGEACDLLESMLPAAA
jgi:UDP:flavonoid glycosyltransferase YjiC (YdhE family)